MNDPSKDGQAHQYYVAKHSKYRYPELAAQAPNNQAQILLILY